MKIKSKFNFIKKLSRLFSKKEKREFIGILFMALLMALFQAVGIASVIPFVSLVMDPNIIVTNEKLAWLYTFFGFSSSRSFIIAVGVLMLSIIIVGNLISALTIWLKTRFVWSKNHKLSTALLERYLTLPYSYFLNQNTSDLGKNILAEVQELTASFLTPILEVIVDLCIVTLILITLIIVSPFATLLIFGVLIIFYGVIIQTGLRKKLKSRGKIRVAENKGRFKAATEALSGIKDIKILHREKYFIEKFQTHSGRFSRLRSWNAVVGLIPKYFIEIMAFGGVIVFILSLLIMERDIQQIIPLVSFFAFAGYRLMPITNKMFNAFTKMQFNTAILDKIYEELMAEGYHITDINEDITKKLQFNDRITIANISFSYPLSETPVFNNLTLEIKKSQSVAIVGPTGTGKTTFVDIILGLLTPTEGEMLVDGTKLEDSNIRSWQRNLGYVPQFIFLSDDSVKRNIAFGVPDDMIDVERVERAARIANLHDFIVRDMPKGYDTLVGERGIRLSGGQRQRVGIARALYSDPDVLVLDEATSSLDGITEESVLKAMDNISRLKTLIIIAHRLTTVKKCDNIFLLDKGEIAAEGTYEELLNTNEQFKAMSREL